MAKNKELNHRNKEIETVLKNFLLEKEIKSHQKKKGKDQNLNRKTQCPNSESDQNNSYEELDVQQERSNCTNSNRSSHERAL